jgi:autotransporter translocation and assembly factor TamB
LTALPDHEITGRGQFERSAGDTLRLSLQLEGSRVENVRLDHVVVDAVVLGSDVVVRQANIAGPLGRLQGSGELRGGILDVGFDAELPKVEEVLRALHRSPSVAGDAIVHGRLRGPTASPEVELESSFGALQSGSNVVWAGTLTAWGHPVGQAPDLDLELHADSLQIRGRVLRGLGADMTWRDGVLRISRSQAEAGDTLVAAVATVQPLERDWNGLPRPTTRLELETALVRLGDTEMRVEDPATVWWRDGAVRVDSLRVVTRGGSLRVDGTYDEQSRALEARAELAGLDLAFLRDVAKLRADVTGTGSGWLEARGTLDRTRIRARLELIGGSWNGLPVDSLHVAIAGSEAVTDIQDLRLVTPSGSLRGNCRVGSIPSLARWLAPTTQSRPLAELESATLSGVFDLSTLQVDRLWQARRAGAPSPDWEARLSCFVALRGTLGAPLLEVRGQADELRTGTLAVDGARFDLDCRHDSLLVHRLDIAAEGQTLHGEGHVPLRISFVRGAALLRDRPVAAQVVLPRTSFRIVERFVPTFVAPPGGASRGDVEMDLQVTGTLASPQARGKFQVYDASFQLATMEEVYHSVNARGEFDGKVLRISAIQAATGSKGIVSGSGELEFEGLELSGYEYRLRLQEVPIYSIPEVSAIASGPLEIHSRRIAGRLIPDLRGTLDVHSAEIRAEFTSSGTQSGTFETDIPDWLASLSLRADKGDVWIRNSLVDAELTGNIDLKRTEDDFQVFGTVRVKRGTYSYLVHRFDIKRGELNFSGKGFNPQIDIEGQTGRAGERIYITLTGTAEEPQLSFRSDRLGASSDMIEQTLFDVTGTEREEATSILVGNYAEQIVRDLQLLSEFSIDPASRNAATSGTTPTGHGGFTGYNVSGGRPIGSNLFVLYTQGFYSDIEQRVAVEYDINRWLLLEAAYERRSVTEAGAGQSQNAYGLGLKYRHEY